MNALQQFAFQTHQLRVEQDEHGNPWFCAKDVCDILGYSNSRKAIADHCKPEGVTKRDTLTDGGIQQLTWIDEGNLYRLIIKSSKPEADAFEAWVCDQVLPSIRKTGGYSKLSMNQEKVYWVTLEEWNTALSAGNPSKDNAEYRLQAIRVTDEMVTGKRNRSPAHVNDMLTLQGDYIGLMEDHVKVLNEKNDLLAKMTHMLQNMPGRMRSWTPEEDEILLKGLEDSQGPTAIGMLLGDRGILA